jgi:hypothetical protein
VTSPHLPDPGLCATCANVRVVGSRRGSRFLLCTLSEADVRYPRYPRLPVLRCRGYRAAGEDGAGDAPAKPRDASTARR